MNNGSLVRSGPDRRPRGWLEHDLKLVTDMFVTGQIQTNGEWLTPHRLTRLIQETGSLEEAPSAGACANVLKRWNEYGFAIVNERPLAFVDYTEKGREIGLEELKAQYIASKKRRQAQVKAPMPQ